MMFLFGLVTFVFKFLRDVLVVGLGIYLGVFLIVLDGMGLLR